MAVLNKAMFSKEGASLLVGLLGIGLLAAACSAGDGSTFGKGTGSSGSGQGGSNGQGGSSSSFNPNTASAGTGVLQTAPDCSDSDPNLDQDGDGWTDNQGDCNDCTELMNPGAMDYNGNNIDEDCNLVPDDNPGDCDAALQLGSTDPVDGARAMGLCKQAAGESWGLVSAQYIRVDGSPNPDPIGYGILDGFGPSVNPQEGAKLFAISSGTARQPTDAGYQDVSGHDKNYTSGAAPGFPKESPACPGVTTGQAHDSVALRLEIKTPTNAKSLAFNINMYTYEFPSFICSTYNDFVTVIMSPTPMGQADGNISFDTQGNPLSVNAGFLEVCSPQSAGGKDFPCALGPGQLSGTGFEDHAATGWLQTTAPIADPGGTITLEFGAWDSGDGILDTTGLVDNFRFDAEETPTETQTVPAPK